MCIRDSLPENRPSRCLTKKACRCGVKYTKSLDESSCRVVNSHSLFLHHSLRLRIELLTFQLRLSRLDPDPGRHGAGVAEENEGLADLFGIAGKIALDVAPGHEDLVPVAELFAVDYQHLVE